MNGVDDVERKIAGIIKALEDGPDKKGTSTIVIVSYSIGILIVVFLIYSKMVPIPQDMISRIVMGFVILMAPAVPAILWSEWKDLKLVKSVAREYYELFPNIKDQLTANAILLKIAAHGSKKPSLWDFRRKVGAITKKFSCSECGNSIKTRSFSSPTLVCDNCNSTLLVDIPTDCPHCDSKDVMICSPKELVGPLQADETTKGLGVFGQLLDLIYYPFRLAFHSALIYSKTHLFKCRGCSATWAVKLPVADSLQ